MPRGLVFDIEGTVGSISFVHDVLFPYSTERMLDYLRSNPPIGEFLEEILKENEKDFQAGNFPRIENPNSVEETNAYLQFLIRSDRKFGALKVIQGKIWKEGFELSDLQAELFSDVPGFLRKSKASGLKNFIYSSGSVEAQKLFFSYSVFGDLSSLIDGYFDTGVGNKKEKESYTRISRETGIAVSDLYFFTDIVEEANAASEAGYAGVYIMNRPGNKPQPDHNHPTLNDFTELEDF